jgi:hypothetical protein
LSYKRTTRGTFFTNERSAEVLDYIIRAVLASMSTEG